MRASAGWGSEGRAGDITEAASVAVETKGRVLRSFLVKAALILGILILVVEGYYVYYWFYDQTASSSAAPDFVAKPIPAGTTPDVTTENRPDSLFVHRATSENVVGNNTYLDDPSTNGNPDVVLSVTQNWNPGGGGDGTYNDHSIGVWYNPNAQRWAIFNQDLAPIPEGAAFNVVVLEGPTKVSS